jgi:hypothetical protein
MGSLEKHFRGTYIACMKTLLLLTIVLPFNLLAATDTVKKPAKLQTSIEFIFEKVLEKKHQAKRSEVPFPKFYFKSNTPLKQFQDAIEKQWGFRPDEFTNAFAVANNEVYIMDDEDYYTRNKRCMDDSIAHELTHYIQVKYLGWDLADESLEWDAIEVQTEFRQEHCKL